MPILCERREAFAIITVSRPELRNAWGGDDFPQLSAALAELAEDDSVNCVMITGDEAGKAFSAGADMTDLKTHAAETPMEFVKNLPKLQSIPDLLDKFPKPVIAAVNGYAIGAGCVISCGSDLTIASDRAQWRLNQANLGIAPQFGMPARVARNIGKSNAMKLALGFPISAEEGYRMGLAQWLVPHEKFMEEALAITRQIASLPALSSRVVKEIINSGSDAGSMKAMVIAEAYKHMVLRMSEDAKESHVAFRERRPPVFKGC